MRLAALASVLLLACAAAPRPCRSPSACPEGSECLANRCMPVGAEPVAPDSRRIVLDPIAVAVIRAGAAREGALPPTVTFGGPSSLDEQLLIDFADGWGEVEVDTAFLLLEPSAGAEPSGDDVEIGVALVTSEWTSGTADELPSSRGPHGSGVGRTRPPAVLRIDVTALVREIAKQPRSARGLLVRATNATERGAVYSTGIDGQAPRLDVYYRPRPKAR